MAKVINRRRKNNVALRLFNDEYEFLTARQKSVVNKNLYASSEELGRLENEIYEKENPTVISGRF